VGADLYVAAFAERCALTRPLGQPLVDEPGIVGLLPTPEVPVARLLVTDDRAYDLLDLVVDDARSGMLTVFAVAERCAALAFGSGWRADDTTAFVLRDLASVPAVPLPEGLALRPVRRLLDDPAGVALEDAAAAAMTADPDIRGGLEDFSGYLRSLPAPTRLFAAVDADGAVRATSGFGVFGTAASVMFVNTDPGWRGRGIGRAMTAAALHAARGVGARHACLDATEAGRSIYLRLGFEVVSATTRFFRGD
jgi:GNAT superfamily N-acetyltransferase